MLYLIHWMHTGCGMIKIRSPLQAFTSSNCEDMHFFSRVNIFRIAHEKLTLFDELD